jgi:hypothetical protein
MQVNPMHKAHAARRCGAKILGHFKQQRLVVT